MPGAQPERFGVVYLRSGNIVVMARSGLSAKMLKWTNIDINTDAVLTLQNGSIQWSYCAHSGYWMLWMQQGKGLENSSGSSN